ncbi:MAG: hypothetical protein ACM3MK_08055 [Chitinophagales bacterium]
MNPGSFSLKYVGQEDHLMMPALTTLTVTQSLYEMLFQYVLTPEREQKLIEFIDRIRVYLSSQGHEKAPFSIKVDELSFLEEGLEELRLLCWQSIPVYIFEIQWNEAEPENNEAVESVLKDLLVFNWKGDSQILVYPSFAI